MNSCRQDRADRPVWHDSDRGRFDGNRSHFAISASRSRGAEAAERIARRLEQIKAGRSPGQPWLDADLQYAAQEAALGVYAARTIKEEDGAEQIRYSMPIEQAIEAVLKERGEVAETNPGEPSERSCSP